MASRPEKPIRRLLLLALALAILPSIDPSRAGDPPSVPDSVLLLLSTAPMVGYYDNGTLFSGDECPDPRARKHPLDPMSPQTMPLDLRGHLQLLIGGQTIDAARMSVTRVFGRVDTAEAAQGTGSALNGSLTDWRGCAAAPFMKDSFSRGWKSAMIARVEDITQDVGWRWRGKGSPAQYFSAGAWLEARLALPE